MKLFLSVLLVVQSPLLADIATQSDWSGGPGILGPVIEFGNEFLSDSGICIDVPGRIMLDDGAIPQQVACSTGDREQCGYPETGYLESSIFDTQDAEPTWAYIYWSYEMPYGTSIGVQVRASDDYTQMGPWSEVFTSQPVFLLGVLDDAASYVQYRVTLSTMDPEATPILRDISIVWPRMGVEGRDPLAGLEILPVSPNPASGPIEAVFGLSSSTSVDILVFDLSGRLVRTAGLVDCQPGWSTIGLGEFDPGVYFFRVQAGELAATERFVVLE